MFLILLLILSAHMSISEQATRALTLAPGNHASLIGEVNEESINQVIETMHYINKPEIVLYLNSPGGYVSEGDKLISYMNYRKQMGTKITCIAQMAHSMAFNIMQNCDLRLVTATAQMMQHQISLGTQGELAKINSYLKMINQISKRLNKAAAKRIGISLEEFEKRVQQDWWTYGEDIVKENVADELAVVGCTPNVRRKDQRALVPFKCPLIK